MAEKIGDLGPANSLATVTPSDDTIVNCRALYVGGAGDVSIMAVNDSAAVTLQDVPAGTILPIACKKVMAATTATNIVALL